MGRHHAAEQIDLDRRVRHDLEQLLVAPDVMFERRHVEVADGDAAQSLPGTWPGLARDVPGGHLAIEIELVGEFHIGVGIGDIAARRDIEVVEQNRIAADIERGLDVAAILLAAAMVDRGRR